MSGRTSVMRRSSVRLNMGVDNYAVTRTTSRFYVAPHGDLLAADRRGLERRDDVVGERFRDFYI